MIDFAQHVHEGLNASPRFLSSRFIYDEIGSALFQEIMQLPEYYLTRTEFAILEQYSATISATFKPNTPFDLIEFGAGDGTKTRLLLQQFLHDQHDFRYLPIDISCDALAGLEHNLHLSWPELEVKPLSDEYFAALATLKDSSRRKLVLFLGSNVGNFTPQQSIDFFTEIASNLHPEDLLLTGFDLKKDPHQIHAAYNDNQGVTSKFNRNLLVRINRELGGNFKPEQFAFYPLYNPETGEVRSYLLSTQQQSVTIEALGQSFDFAPWESIHTEISRKYDLPQIEALAEQSGFAVHQHLTDQNNLFVDSLWKCL